TSVRHGNAALIEHDDTHAQPASRAASRAPFDPDEPEDLPKDLWFEPYRIPATDRARAVVQDVTHQVQSLERFRQTRKRKRRATDQARLEATVSAVVCDAMHHYLLGSPGDGLVVTRSK